MATLCRSQFVLGQFYLKTPYLTERNVVRYIVTSSAACSKKHYDGPLVMYDSKVKDGELNEDKHQREIVQSLQSLHEQMKGYQPEPVKGPGFFSSFFSKSKSSKQKEDQPIKYTNSPLGLYLYGSVGSGKTMLMDYFYHTCHVQKKQRIHFHQFMLSIHKKIHQVKKEMVPTGYNLNRSAAYDPIPPVAQDIAQQTSLLCFDEFQVTDIADAMILKRLFSHLWKNGVVIIATSNRHPDDLYKNGLQRINFLPFIPMLKANCDHASLDSGIDYRRKTKAAEQASFFVMSKCDAKYEMDRWYEDLVSREHAEEAPRTLNVMNRQVYLPKTCGRVLDCTFKQLCSSALGAVDYLELCEEFDTVLMREIPCMNLENRSEARRFITFIDTLYDHKMRMICSAETEVDELFATGDLSEWDKHHKRILIGDLNIAIGDDNEGASLFTGEEELFAFERVKSRLTEMQTEEYWDQRQILKVHGHRVHKKVS